MQQVVLLVAIKQPAKLQELAVGDVKIPEIKRVKGSLSNSNKPNLPVAYVEVDEMVAVIR